MKAKYIKGGWTMSKVLKRFLEYVKIETTSDANSDTSPSTEGQLEFARKLGRVKRFRSWRCILDDGYVMATLPSNIDKKVPTIDLSPIWTLAQICPKGCKPKIVENYDGGDIVLRRKKYNIICFRISRA